MVWLLHALLPPGNIHSRVDKYSCHVEIVASQHLVLPPQRDGEGGEELYPVRRVRGEMPVSPAHSGDDC